MDRYVLRLKNDEVRRRGLMSQPPQDATAADQVERRRHARYRMQERIFVRRKNGQTLPGVTSEISISGLSAALDGVLRIEEEVQLTPVAGEALSAIVRRKVGSTYGFEFSNPPDSVVEAIHILCRGLVPFRTTAND